MIDASVRLWATCHSRGGEGPCLHSKEIDLVALRGHIGADASAMAQDLAPRMRCAICGGKAIGFTVIPNARTSGDPRGVLGGTVWATRAG